MKERPTHQTNKHTTEQRGRVFDFKRSLSIQGTEKEIDKGLKERRKGGKGGKTFTRSMDLIETKFQPFFTCRGREIFSKL